MFIAPPPYTPLVLSPLARTTCKSSRRALRSCLDVPGRTARDTSALPPRKSGSPHWTPVWGDRDRTPFPLRCWALREVSMRPRRDRRFGHSDCRTKFGSQTLECSRPLFSATVVLYCFSDPCLCNDLLSQQVTRERIAGMHTEIVSQSASDRKGAPTQLELWTWKYLLHFGFKFIQSTFEIFSKKETPEKYALRKQGNTQSVRKRSIFSVEHS